MRNGEILMSVCLLIFAASVYISAEVLGFSLSRNDGLLAEISEQQKSIYSHMQANDVCLKVIQGMLPPNLSQEVPQ